MYLMFSEAKYSLTLRNTNPRANTILLHSLEDYYCGDS